jgi:large subunit ribosomal protein L9
MKVPTSLPLLFVTTCLQSSGISVSAFLVPVASSARLVRYDTLARTQPTFLQSKKKATAPVSSKKLQVKLLKQVPGTGQKGEVIYVSPAFYQNKLQPSQSATIISDDQVEKENDSKRKQQEELDQKAAAYKALLESNTILITRKTGPDGQLFGGVGIKQIANELPSGYDESRFKITAILDQDGNKIKGDIIKHVGDNFGAMIQLTKDIEATIRISVEAQAE